MWFIGGILVTSTCNVKRSRRFDVLLAMATCGEEHLRAAVSICEMPSFTKNSRRGGPFFGARDTRKRRALRETWRRVRTSSAHLTELGSAAV